MIYVTHDQVEAMTLADQIVVLNAGRVEQVGAPLELYHRPRNLFVAGFLGSPKINLLDATVAAAGPGSLRARLANGAQIDVPVSASGVQPGDRVTIGIRPEHLRPQADGPFTGGILLAEKLGAETYVHVRLDDHQTIVLRQEGTAFEGGGRMTLGPVSSNSWHAFAADGTALPRLA